MLASRDLELQRMLLGLVRPDEVIIEIEQAPAPAPTR